MTLAKAPPTLAKAPPTLAKAPPTLAKAPPTAAKTPPEEQPGTRIMEFELEERAIVEQAARRPTTIQQAPAIITVITAQEIRERGYRTVGDVLGTIPGFEGDRFEFHGWYRDTLTRGIPGTLLVLLDGVNIVDPARNFTNLDRKIPLETVKRIEVTSGPGSVLWGSNALLGVVNIITYDGQTGRGLEVSVGGGDGPGARGSAKLHVAWGGALTRNESVSLRLSATLYTTRGPQLSVHEQRLYGPLPAPSQDGTALVRMAPTTIEPFARDYYINTAGNLKAGPVTLGWNLGWETEAREQASSGAILSQDYRSDGGDPAVIDGLVSRGGDPFHLLYARYQDSFLDSALNVHAQAHWVHWSIREDPLGVFPASDVLPFGTTTRLSSNQGTHRLGLNLDVDWRLPAKNHLLLGGEVFSDLGSDSQLTSFHPWLGADSPPTECPTPFEWRPDRDPLRPCSVEQIALQGVIRTIAALYAADEWQINPRWALNVGLRGQFSSTYAPALLLSGGTVFGVTDRVFLKLNYAEGFRPPDFQSTATRGDIASGVTFDANPNLDVERSRAVDAEVNAVLFENAGPIRQLYLRADYAYTRMENVIAFPAGRYENTGVRDINTLELLAKLVFHEGSELWASYYFVDVVDSEAGRLRNIANHIINAGGRLALLDGHLNLLSVLTVRGAMEDLNRTGTLTTRPILTSQDAVWVESTGVEVTAIPTAVLLRLGIEARDLFGIWNIGAWVYNALNTDYSDPDLFFDDRIMGQPQPRAGLSFFVQTGVRL